ncbi:MAG: DUF3857 domain-containing protein [Persicimonas sp.]
MSLFGAPAWAAEEDDEHGAEVRAERLLEEVASETDDGVAIGKLAWLDRYRSHLDPATLAPMLEEAAERTPSPLVRFHLLRDAARYRLEAGDFEDGKDGMQGAMADQGCLRDWQMVGPFDNPSMDGLHAPLPPEEGEAGPYAGKMVEVDWREAPAFDRLCDYSLSSAVEPSSAAVVYMATEIEAERAGPARLLLGADGAFKAWLNGEPIAQRDEDTGLRVDGEAWPVELERGKNQLLIKVGSTGSGGLGLAARLVDANLEPIEDIDTRAHWNGEAVEPFDEADVEPTDQGLASRAERTADEDEASAEAVWAAYQWSRVEPEEPGTPWRSTGEEVLEAVRDDEASLPARELTVAAALFDDHWKRLELLELAHERDPDDPWIRLWLSEEYADSLSKETRRLERDVLEELLEERPDFQPARLGLGGWYDNAGFSKKAHRLLEEGADEAVMRSPDYVRKLAYLSREVGERQRARELFERLEGQNALNTWYAFQRMTDLVESDRYDEALELIRAQRELVPWSINWARREANVLRAQGDADGALEVIEKLLEKRPGSTSLYSERAELLLAMDRREEALETIERAVAIRPQNRDLVEFRAFLQPEAARFYEPWVIENVAELDEQHPPGDDAWDTLIDQTLIHASSNGLSTEFVQRADRAIESDGLDSVRYHRISHTRNDEQVEVLGVRVHKPDGTITEDYDQWSTGSSKKGATTYNDSTYVHLRANNVEVGDIVEFRYRVSEVANENFRGDYFGKLSYVQSSRPIALSRFAVHYPDDWELYFREPTVDFARLDDEAPGDARVREGYRVDGFEMRDVPEVDTDSGQPGSADIYDYAMVSNKETYDEIGRWWWNLIEEQLIVDATIEEKVAELTEGLDDDREKLEAIHNYVVQNTRYLHVGLGVHGWKPYRTTTCYRNRYGDCKDKAALLKVMLEEAGIPTKMVLVRTRKLGTVDEYPAAIHIFNHAIAYVPSMDLYLDGTAEYNGSTELPSMDQGAQAVVVDDGGAAKTVTLPIDKPEDNLVRRKLTVDLSGDTPEARGTLTVHGNRAAGFRRKLEDGDRRDEAFEKDLSNDFPGATLTEADYSDISDLERPVEVDFAFRGGRLVRTSGERRFVYPLGAPKDLLSSYAKTSTRSQDLTIRLPSRFHTTIRYEPADGARFEGVPDDTNIDSEFGSMTIDYERDGDDLVVDVRYDIATQRVAVEDYEDFRDFVSQMTSALNETVRIE